MTLKMTNIYKNKDCPSVVATTTGKMFSLKRFNKTQLCTCLTRSQKCQRRDWDECDAYMWCWKKIWIFNNNVQSCKIKFSPVMPVCSLLHNASS